MALASFAAPSGCKPTSCTLLACHPVHARITAHVGVPLAELVASRSKLCWREVCADLVTTSPEAGPSPRIAFAPTSPLVGTATLSGEGPDASRLELELQFFTRARDGDFVYTRQADGDLYRVTVVDAAGKTLFDVERAATYEESYPNGPDCDPEPCRRTTLDLAQ